MGHVALVSKVAKIDKHPHADNLDILEISGFNVIVRKDEYKLNDLVIMIEPESLVPKDLVPWIEESKRIPGKCLIKVKKIRGIYSQGLLLPAPKNSKEGDDYFTTLNIEHYNPVSEVEINEDKGFTNCPINFSKYDVENLRKFKNYFVGKDVTVSEKIHGENCCVHFHDGKLYVKSRSFWRPEGNNSHWLGVKQTPNLESFCQNNPHLAVFGEVAGHVKGFNYGVPAGEKRFFIFDIIDKATMKWLDIDQVVEITNQANLITAPLISASEQFDFDRLTNLVEQNSHLASHVMEGVVVKTVKEEWHPKVGRMQAKLVSNRYLDKS